MANQTAAYFLEDDKTITFPNPRDDKHVFGKVFSKEYLMKADVNYLDGLSTKLIEMCFRKLKQEEFDDYLRQIK